MGTNSGSRSSRQIASHRVEAAVRVAEFQQRVVEHGAQAAAQHGKDAQLVVGPLDGAQRGAQRPDLFAPVERFRPDQQVRDAARLQRAHILLRQVGAEIREAAEENADVLRLDADPRRRVERSRTFQPLSLQSHSMKAATAFGEHASIFTLERLRVP